MITAGGTGCTKRDITPEVTLEVIDRVIPGVSEYLRYEGSKSTVNSYLSRGISGTKDETLVVNLPGSPKAAIENFMFLEKLLFHLMETIKK